MLLALALAGCGGSSSGGSAAVSVVPAATAAADPIVPVAITSARDVASLSGADVDVVLVLGQSNATGYQVDRSTDYVPTSDVMAWTGTRLVQYTPNVATGIEWYNTAGYWAAELNLIRHLRGAEPARKLLVLRYTASGSQLAAGPTQDWNTATSGELLDGARTFVRQALAALRAQNARPRIRLVWWQQGEADRDPALGALYGGNLVALVAALRDPAGDFAVPATVPIAIGRLASRFGDTAVRSAEAAVARADTGGAQVLLDVDDLPFESDGLHLTRAAQLTLGDRLWAIDQRTYSEPE